MSTKRHKWMKLGGHDFIREDAHFFREDAHRHRVDDTKECVNCGLRKGYCKTMGFFSTLVYYNTPTPYGKLLSKNKIPFECTEINLQIRQLESGWKKEDFLTIEDFNLD